MAYLISTNRAECQYQRYRAEIKRLEEEADENFNKIKTEKTCYRKALSNCTRNMCQEFDMRTAMEYCDMTLGVGKGRRMNYKRRNYDRK